MKLFWKIIGLIFSIALGFTLAAFLTIQSVSQKAHLEFIEQFKDSQILSIQTYISDQSYQLLASARDNAHWTEFRDALLSDDKTWLSENITDYMVENEMLNVDSVFINFPEASQTIATGKLDIPTMTSLKQAREIEVFNIDRVQLYWINDALYILSGTYISNNDAVAKSGIFILARSFDNLTISNLNDYIDSQHLLSISISDKELKSSFDSTSGILKFDAPVYNGIEDIAYIHLEYDISSFIKLFSKSAKTIFTIIVICVVIAVSIFAVQMNVWNKRLVKIIDDINIIASTQQYDLKLQEKGGFEAVNLSRSINRLTTEINDHLDSIENHYIESIEVVAKAMEVNDPYTKGHAERVAEFAVEIAKAGNYDIDIEHLRLAGLLHDIGKIGIPHHILNKPGKLDDSEYIIIKSHSEKGYAILNTASIFEDVKHMVLYHHEKFDGSGYPTGISGNNIPLGARILAIADVFDAISSDRAYRDAMPFEKVMSIMVSESGKAFDPDILEVFLKISDDIFPK
jgi:putative nucleotidyltransferase with HDIG domain